VIPAVVVLLVVGGLIWLGQRGLIYFPESYVPPPAAVGLARADPVSFATEDGLTLGGWFVPPDLPATGHTVVVFNGNAGNRANRAELADRLAARGVATLLFDYRGYGGNPGLPSELGLTRDARAALTYLKERPDVDRSRIVYFGESLGAAVAVELAIEDQPAALILRSPFTSLTAIGARHYPFLPVRWLLRDRYPAIDRIARVRSPLLVIAGDADRIVPLDDTEALYDAAVVPKRLVVVPDADHNDRALSVGAELVDAVVDLLGNPLTSLR
jgi:fermentation-respiration switch protein FrsA (DUF1100 family)